MASKNALWVFLFATLRLMGFRSNSNLKKESTIGPIQTTTSRSHKPQYETDSIFNPMMGL